MTAKTLALAFAFALSAVAGAQSWSRSYDAGLAAARAGKWAAARESFQQAAAGRPDDRSAPTVLPGPATERKLWRDGAPYSPNFLAAYSLYRQALVTADAMEASQMLRTAAGELETLVAKDQSSAEAFFFLDIIYTKLGDATKRQIAADRMTKLGRKADFKVDDEIVAPEELAALQARTTGTAAVTTIPRRRRRARPRWSSPETLIPALAWSRQPAPSFRCRRSLPWSLGRARVEFRVEWFPSRRTMPRESVTRSSTLRATRPITSCCSRTPLRRT